MDQGLESTARAALVALARDGSPVVRPETMEQAIGLGWRRWRSYERRHIKGSTDFEARVEDLAKGLRDEFETDPKSVGPLMEDYRFLARTLGTCFGGRGGAKEPNSI